MRSSSSWSPSYSTGYGIPYSLRLHRCIHRCVLGGYGAPLQQRDRAHRRAVGRRVVLALHDCGHDRQLPWWHELLLARDVGQDRMDRQIPEVRPCEAAEGAELGQREGGNHGVLRLPAGDWRLHRRGYRIPSLQCVGGSHLDVHRQSDALLGMDGIRL